MKADGSVAVDPEVELTRLKLQKSFEGSVTLDGTEGEVIGIRPVCSASASWTGSIGVQYRTGYRQFPVAVVTGMARSQGLVRQVAREDLPPMNNSRLRVREHGE